MKTLRKVEIEPVYVEFMPDSLEENKVYISERFQVYPNACGFLWTLSKKDGGTDLGWSEFNGNDELSGTFKTYEDALEDAVNLINKHDLSDFRRQTPADKFHWGNYANYLSKYRETRV